MNAVEEFKITKSELMYEVAIRGESPSDNVAGLRRQVNKLTQLYPSDDIIDSVYDFSDDIEGVQETLDKIKTNLDLLKNNFNEPLFNRTKSLLHHLFYRLQRIEKPETVDETSLLKKCKKCYETFYENLVTLPGSKIREPKDLASTSDDDSLPTNVPNISGLNISVSCDRGLVGEFAKLKYDGKTCVRSFIQKLEEFRLSKGISEDKMLTSAFDIFIGDALHWSYEGLQAFRYLIVEFPNIILLYPLPAETGVCKIPLDPRGNVMNGAARLAI
ncbi:hypothetical protein K1T71_009750 [Dendrolimus kikuchii]|uniref:Uncharacterized protein n=1 Tax=Dendrolimus kikuchii TaxID=765133 RepID=A0ACC1CTS3_9NEOP|nr:hypothetical protein K1T71_009750 [Dendrolimus kikuchii]